MADDNGSSDIVERHLREKAKQAAQTNPLHTGPHWSEPGTPIPTNPLRRPQQKEQEK